LNPCPDREVKPGGGCVRSARGAREGDRDPLARRR